MNGVVDVPTVTGSVRSDELGITLMHEHIFILAPELEDNYPDEWDADVQVAAAVRKLNAAKERGVNTIVDLTVLGLGRNIPLIQRVAEQVDLNIVIATGAYVTNALPLPFTFQDPNGPVGGREVLIEMFENDARHGVADTGVRAAIIKCATDVEGVTKDVERVLRAVAQVQKSTSLPIFTHTDAASQRGLEQQAIFSEEGADLGKVVVGHCGDTDDMEYLGELLAAGSYLGLDRFGLYNLLDFDRRLDVVLRLCAEGYASRLVLSHDASCYLRWGARLRDLAPDWHYTHLIDEVLPALSRRGLSKADIEQLMVANPRNIFEAGAIAAPTERSN